jgi:hypothetical protein
MLLAVTKVAEYIIKMRYEHLSALRLKFGEQNLNRRGLTMR